MLIILILIIAAAARLLALGQLPPGLYLDEVLYGLDAMSLSQTGQDIYGHSFPLAFQSSGYYPPVYPYLLAPLLLFLPLSAWVVRLPAAIGGIITVLGLYQLTKLLSPNYKYAPILAAGLLAISPWHIHLSRVAFLGSFGIAFLVYASYFLISGNLILGTLLLAIATHIHYGYKLLAPILGLVLIRKITGPVIMITLIALLTNWYALTKFSGLSRVTELKITNPVTIVSAYLQAFSPNFLIIKGDHYPLINPFSQGQLLWATSPLIIIGFVLSYKTQRRYFWLMPIWLAVTPLASAMTGLGAHAVRVSPMLISFTFYAAIGADYLIRKYRPLAVCLSGILMYQLIISFHIYSNQSPTLWGAKERQLITTQSVFLDSYNSLLTFYAFERRVSAFELQQAIAKPVTFNGLPAKILRGTYFIPQEEIAKDAIRF